MKKFAITVTPRMLSRLRLVRASRNPSRSSVIVEVRAAAGRPDVLPDGSASPARPTGTTSKIRSRRASDHRSIDSATGRAGGTRGTHISRNRPTPSMPATARKAVPTPARSATAPPSNCPAATPDASAIVSHAIALCSRYGPTMSSSSARRLVMSTTQPMPAKSRNGNSSKMPSWVGPLGEADDGDKRHEHGRLEPHRAAAVEAIRDDTADGAAEQQRRPHDRAGELHHPRRVRDLVDVVAREECDRPASPVPAQAAEPQRREPACCERSTAAELGLEARRFSGGRPPAHQRGILRASAAECLSLLLDQAGTPDAGATVTGTPLTAALPDGTSTKSGGTSTL